MVSREDRASDGVYIELVRTIYGAFLPALIMSVGFAVAGGLISWRTGDRPMLLITILGVLTCAIRLFIALYWKAEAGSPVLDVARARSLERRFGIAYLGFAVVLGGFGVRAFMLPFAEIHMLATCLLIGYGAGVAAGIGLRPRIAVPAILIAIMPGMIVGLFHADPFHWATSAMSLGLVGGGISSVLAWHRGTVKELGQRIAFGHLARRDALTDLPNRLAMREWFDERQKNDREMLAVHCLDLDGFKPVNDGFGHPVGDALLGAVAQRLDASIRAGDMVARMGGDEFIIIERGIANADEAALLAQRLAATIARPFRIGDHTITISASVGYIVSTGSRDDLERLIACADEALYVAKRRGGGVISYELLRRARSTVAAA